MSDMFLRSQLLLGEDNFNKLANSTVLVVGVGGVGSICVEALARSGVKKIIVVDNDVIDITNLNRQLQTNEHNIGKSKVDEMIKHIKNIKSDIDIVGYNEFFNENSEHLLKDVDFVIDAIDTISSKLTLIKMCLKNQVNFISSLGMGNRLDPSKVFETTLDKTSYDPLAKVLRTLARKEHLDLRKIRVAYSSEHPIKQNLVVNANGKTNKQRIPPASMLLVPPAAGLLCASVCIRELVKDV